MKQTHYIALLALATPLLLTSCIREDIPDCRALSLTLAVRDKNYENVDRVPEEQRLDERLDLKAYVPTLKWTLRDVKTGEVVEEQPLDLVRRDGRELDITFCECVPFGTYVFTAYGKLQQEEQVDPQTGIVTLHPDETEGGDVYLANDTLVYDAYSAHYRSELFRAKDELIVELENIPDTAYTATLHATHLYAHVDPTIDPEPKDVDDWRFYYADTTHATVTRTLHPGELFKTSLAPSTYHEKAALHLTLQLPSHQTLQPEDVTVPLERNNISVVRYVFNPDKGSFTIYILVNGAWETLSQMDLE